LALLSAVPIIELVNSSKKIIDKTSNEVQRENPKKRVLFCFTNINHIWNIFNISYAVSIPLLFLQMEYD
jgi:hypothetical protein